MQKMMFSPTDINSISMAATADVNVKKRKISKSVYKHIPHREKPPHLVAKRNARERRRVQAVNNAFAKLRKAVPIENRNKRLSKVKTLQRAIEYIESLQIILGQVEPVQSHHHHHHHHNTSKQSNLSASSEHILIQSQSPNTGVMYSTTFSHHHHHHHLDSSLLSSSPGGMTRLSSGSTVSPSSMTFSMNGPSGQFESAVQFAFPKFEETSGDELSTSMLSQYF